MIEFPSAELCGYISLVSLVFWSIKYPKEMSLVLMLKDGLLVPALNVIVYAQVLVAFNMIILKVIYE